MTWVTTILLDAPVSLVPPPPPKKKTYISKYAHGINHVLAIFLNYKRVFTVWSLYHYVQLFFCGRYGLFPMNSSQQKLQNVRFRFCSKVMVLIAIECRKWTFNSCGWHVVKLPNFCRLVIIENSLLLARYKLHTFNCLALIYKYSWKYVNCRCMRLCAAYCLKLKYLFFFFFIYLRLILPCKRTGIWAAAPDIFFLGRGAGSMSPCMRIVCIYQRKFDKKLK